MTGSATRRRRCPASAFAVMSAQRGARQSTIRMRGASPCRRRCRTPTGRRPAATRRTAWATSPARDALAQAWRADIGEGGGYRRKITAAAGDRRRPGVHHGQRRRGRAPSTLDTGGRIWRARHAARRTTAAPMSAAASRWTAARCTPPPAAADVLALDAARRARSAGAARSATPPAPRRPSPRAGCYVPTLDDQLLALVADGWQAAVGLSGAGAATARARPAVARLSPTGCWWPASAPAIWSACAPPPAPSPGPTASPRRAAAPALADLSAIRGLPVIERRPGLRHRPRRPDGRLDLRSGRRLWERDIGSARDAVASPATGCSC